MLPLLALCVLLIFPVITLAQSGSALDFGNTTFYNFNGTTGTSQQFGNLEFYNFNNGQSATRQNSGGIDFYSSPSPGLSGSVLSSGNQAFGNWNDGTRSTHQNFGGMQFDTYQRDGKTTQCTSQRYGNQAYTNCQ